MADNRTPNQAANMEKAKGDRDTVEPQRRDEVNPSERYGNDRDDHAGGITNRPLDEEIENQDALPERGSSQKEERTASGPGGGRDLDLEERIERERREEQEDIIARDDPRRTLTPRRYDEEEKDATDATLPSDDSTYRTEI